MSKRTKLPTATQVAYFHNCTRELWLHANNVNMEHNSAFIAEGKLISENSYDQRPEKYTELQFDHIKIDYYDAKNNIVYETKKSNKRDELHLWQIKYYMYTLLKTGVENVSGILEYPKMRIKEEVFLSKEDIEYLDKIIPEIQAITGSEFCPSITVPKAKCKNCSYFDLCYVAD